MPFPTRLKVRISSKLSYPVGAELISAELEHVPQAESLEIRFFSKYETTETRGKAYSIFTVSYVGTRSPHFQKGWAIEVRPVPRALKHTIKEALKREFFPRIRQQKGALSYIHLFNYSDGAWPLAPPTQGNDGDFYGVTYAGGNNGCYFGCGTIFKMTPEGAVTVLHVFESTEGNTPFNSLVLGSDGDFYGTSTVGGTNNSGTVFKITPSGQLSTLSSLVPKANLEVTLLPNLVQGTDGNLYGITSFGGCSNNGTIYRVSVGLAPFVKLLPAAAAVGSTITIFGTKAAGAVKVTFGGVAASFTQASPTSISAIVPAGSKNGTVEVTASAGILRSNLPFQVLQ